MDKNNYLEKNHNEFKEIMKECENLRWKKLNDVGLLVKLGDKYGRIKRLYEKSQDGEKPNFETSRDSLIDLVNYAVMALMEVNKNDKN